jgi:glycosyltransferase involved in cell wall biosynthesis
MASLMDGQGSKKMKIQLVNTFDNFRWKDGYIHALNGNEVEYRTKACYKNGIDCYIFLWCDEQFYNFIKFGNNPKHKHKIITFIRRYEMYSYPFEEVNWDKIDAVIMVNDYLAEWFLGVTKKVPYVIYNSVDLSKWRYAERGHGKNIAWVGYINKKKNLPLAFQVMAGLPRDYTLHVAGGLQCGESMDYLQCISEDLGIKVVLYGHIDGIDSWLDDKNYLLSTSLSEGCPNNVIEAMAKGIKPIVHNWPGSKCQFGDYVFNTVDEAVSDILPESHYDSSEYYKLVEEKFGPSNYRRFRKIVDDVLHGISSKERS